MDEIYRGYRIAITRRGPTEGYSARITRASGPLVPVVAGATALEGEDVCLTRARAALDRWLSFLGEDVPQGNRD